MDPCQNNRFYARRTTALGQVRNVLAVGKNCGPGYLELWSPDALVQWTVTQSGDGKADTRVFRTGPASKAGVYLPRGGECVAETLALWTVGLGGATLEYNGFISRLAPQPEVRAKFYPGLTQRPKLLSQRFAIAGPIAGQVDRPSISSVIGGVEFAFPPHYSLTGLLTTDQPLTVRTISALDATTRQLRVVAGPTPTAVPIVVGAFEFLNITSQQIAANIQVLWTERLILFP